MIKNDQDSEESIIGEVFNTIDNLKLEATKLNKISRLNRVGQIIFNTFVVILGVLTPAMVTYQSLVGNSSTQILTIILTASIGAVATLQSHFRFKDQFILNANTSFELEILASETYSKFLSISVTKTKKDNWTNELVDLVDWSLTMKKRIKTKHLRVLTENVTVVTQAEINQVKKVADKTNLI